MASCLNSCAVHFGKVYAKVNQYICRKGCRIHGCKMLLMNAATIRKNINFVKPSLDSLFSIPCTYASSQILVLVASCLNSCASNFAKSYVKLNNSLAQTGA